VILELSSNLRDIIERLLLTPKPSSYELNRIKIEVSREYKLGRIPGNSQIINALKPEEVDRLMPILRRKATRAASGVNVIAVMTEPSACPHGRCAYCPGGPEEGVPQSYTGHEPAAMRAIQNDYDPFRQVTSRIEQLRAIGHEVDKVDLIIMGGTFPASSPGYQKKFVKGCLDALGGSVSCSFEEAKSLAERTGIRNVGLTVETRPDCVGVEDVDTMLDLGVTRVEMGVQNIYDEIYKIVERGHTVNDVVEATKLLKDSGLKVCYHMMLGLPGASIEKDLAGFATIFNDPRFKPDMIKIYPTLVINGTKLNDWWKKGLYKPLTTEEAVELVVRIKEIVPRWIRIMRVQRDIPTPLIEAGVDKSNLRQLVHERMRMLGVQCNCIRCREIGHKDVKIETANQLEILIQEYSASEGSDVFISVEETEADVLVGFLRLRMPSDEIYRPEVTSSSAFVRELHIYGRMVPLGEIHKEGWQHRGWGGVLMSEAERIAFEEYDASKILVMSALGTRQYFERLGYQRDGVYMSKAL
jgi:elongator complex protein 3